MVLSFAPPPGMNLGSVLVGKGEGYSIGNSEGGLDVSACRVEQGIREWIKVNTEMWCWPWQRRRRRQKVCVCFYLFYIYILVLYNFLHYVTSLPDGISLWPLDAGQSRLPTLKLEYASIFGDINIYIYIYTHTYIHTYMDIELCLNKYFIFLKFFIYNPCRFLMGVKV